MVGSGEDDGHIGRGIAESHEGESVVEMDVCDDDVYGIFVCRKEILAFGDAGEWSQEIAQGQDTVEHIAEQMVIVYFVFKD